MATEQELSRIAKRIRDLRDTERSDDLFLTSVWRLVRKATELGAFAAVEFTEFKAFFDAWRETEKIHTQPCYFNGEAIGGQHDKLPLTMLDAVNWLAKNGSFYGCNNINLKRVIYWDMIPEDNGYSCSEQISYPKRDTLRGHFELLAILVERTAPKPTEAVAGDSGKEVWLTATELEKLTAVNRGTIKRAADRGEIQTNGCDGHDKRYLFLSFHEWHKKRANQDG